MIAHTIPENEDTKKALKNLKYTLVVDGPITFIQSRPVDLGQGEAIVRISALRTDCIVRLLLETQSTERLVTLHGELNVSGEVKKDSIDAQQPANE